VTSISVVVPDAPTRTMLPPSLLSRHPSWLSSLVGWPRSWLGGSLSGRREYLEGTQTSSDECHLGFEPCRNLFLIGFHLSFHFGRPTDVPVFAPSFVLFL
jgi:hypothetical protein